MVSSAGHNATQLDAETRRRLEAFRRQLNAMLMSIDELIEGQALADAGPIARPGRDADQRSKP